MFKLIGFIAGYFIFGLFGALFGLFIGSVIDRARIYGSGAINPLQNAHRQTVFLETLFISLGKLSKADGQVSAEEIEHAEACIKKLGMSADHRLRAIDLFKQGSAPAFDIGPTVDRFMVTCGRTSQLKQVLLAYLIVMALTDGRFHPDEEVLLKNVAYRLGYDDASFKHLMEMVQSQLQFGGGKPNADAALDDAYKALGVRKENTDQEIKRAYRKLMSQYHPDKLIGQGLPKDMIDVATEQAKEIQLAHDLIKKTRNI
jgi:DnaJ like chaperone protein